MNVSDFYDIPRNSFVLLSGPSGSGKSTFCKETVQYYLKNRTGLVMYFTTESRPDEIIESLLAGGIKASQLERIRIVDAYSETLANLPETKYKVAVDGADCTDLTGLGAKISKFADLVNITDSLLVFDSLSAPYIFNGEKIIKFLRMNFTRFALKGNRVLACISEGIGKSEDLAAMWSISNGVIRIEPQIQKRILKVTKFPNMKPTELDYVLKGSVEPVTYNLQNPFMAQWFSNFKNMQTGNRARQLVPDRVNLIWQQLALWGGMLWDKRFPTMMYNYGRDLYYQATKEMIPAVVQQNPQIKGKKDLIDLVNALMPTLKGTIARLGGGEIYMDEQKTNNDEIHLGWNESDICFSFPNVNGAICYLYSGAIAGTIQASTDYLEQKRSWEAVEYMCLGLGDSTCRARAVQAGSDSFTTYIESADDVKIDRVNDRITEQMASYLLTGQPPVQRRRSGEGIHVLQLQKAITLPALSSDTYWRALSMAGVNSGMKLAEYLNDRGISASESINQLGKFLAYANVGQVKFGESLRIVENAETVGLRSNMPICSFTTGFLNGFATVTKGTKVHENVCQTAGGDYCEWVFPH
jgi:predicted hydrocarbon binding protein/KaiC/GvpD/RAD55 family RecA-like ATPase